MKPVTLTIRDGAFQVIYADDRLPLLELGAATVTRASHVEPHPAGPGWLADMTPSRGPVLGATGDAQRPHRDCDCQTCEQVVEALVGFPTRQAALDAEVAWLQVHRGL